MNHRPEPRRRADAAAVLSQAALLLALSVAATDTIPAQASPPLSTDPALAERRLWSQTLEQLGERDDEGFLAPPARRIALLEAFLEKLPELPPEPPRFGVRHRLRSEAWSRLATLHLAQRDGERARTAFGRITALAGTAQLDLRGRARFGIAQAHEAEGELETAKELLEQLAADPEFTGTRYSDWARTALSRIDRGSKIGQPAPDFGPRRDLSDQVRTLHDADGRPVLLLFGSAEDANGLRRLDAALRAGAQAGLEPEQMPLLLVDVYEKERAVRLAAEHDWKQPILPSASAFIDRTLLDYQVATLPAWVLIGPDGRLLSRDAPPHRIQEILGGIPLRD